MKSQTEGKKTPYNDYMSIIKTATKWISRADSKVRQRCLIEGCRYGIGLPKEEPQDKCIYCGEPRPNYEDFKMTSLVKSLLKK